MAQTTEKIVTKKVRFAFCFLDPDHPNKMEITDAATKEKSVKESFDVTAIFSDPEEIRRINALLTKYAFSVWGEDQTKALLAANKLKWPLKSNKTKVSSKDASRYAGFEDDNGYHMTFSSYKADYFDVVDASAKVHIPGKDIEAGFYGCISGSVGSFDHPTSKGLKCWLNAVQLLDADPEHRLIQRANAAEDFGAVEGGYSGSGSSAPNDFNPLA